MACYKFTYKDVLKRYERILNKPSKFEIRLLVTILLIITIVNITSLCFASDIEEVEYTTISGMAFDERTNHFVIGATGRDTGYFALQKGYIYYIYNGTASSGVFLATSNDIPSNNLPLTYIGRLNAGDTYSYLATNDDYLYFSFTNTRDVTVTRQKVEGQQGAINDLVDNVGISQIWSIFDTSIGFVGVVVLFAFGIFLIVLAVKKVSKGKSEF